MQIGVIGINHKLAPLALRETIAKACARRFGLANPLDDGTFVLLSTCNRCEIYFHSYNLSAGQEQILSILKEEISETFDQKLYTFFGMECFLHLAKVASGLDSAIIAETEIQGQVKSAYTSAKNLRRLSKDLHFLFQKSLKVAKEVRRNHLALCQVPDLEHALFWHAKDYFNNELPSPLFVGASEINVKIARFFHQKGLKEMVFCNRTEATGMHLANEFNAKFLSWESLQTRWQDFSWVIAGTKNPHHLLQTAPQQAKKTLLVDLAVPRNIDPTLNSSTCQLVNIDDLNLLLEKRKALLKENIYQAENRLVHAVQRSIAIFRSSASPLPLAVSY